VSTPFVSVILPVFNGQKYLKDAIHSILQQSFRDLELIVVDDGSTDDSAAIAEAFNDKRVKVLRNGTNRGVAYTLNRAMDESQGKYIARMDSDDVALKNRLKLQLGYLEKHPEISLLGGSILCFGESNQRVNYWQNHQAIHAHCLFSTPFAHPVVCWRKCDFESNGLRYQESPPTAEDYELWERACRKIRCANLSAPLIRYRIDPQIKISSYLTQQIEGAKSVRNRLLDLSGIDLRETHQELLHKMGEGSIEPSRASLKEASFVYREIIRKNQSRSYFDEEALLRVISKHWYRLICGMIGLVEMQDILGFIRESNDFGVLWKYRMAAYLNARKSVKRPA